MGATPTIEPKPVSAEVAAMWTKIVRAPGVGIATQTVLMNLRVLALEEKKVVLTGEARYVEAAEKRLPQIGDLLTKELGRPVQVFVQREATPTMSRPGESSGVQEAPREAKPSASAQEPAPQRVALPAVSAAEAVADPLVKTAMEAFQARIVAVTARPKDERGGRG